jgi:type IV pilus assembly protein PilW
MKLPTRIPAAALRRKQSGVSLVELMVAVTLGLLLMAGLASIFASTSASRQEMERSARQIENGRFAMELLTDDLRMAGFYGEYSVPVTLAPSGTLDPCSIDPADWNGAIPVAVQHYDVSDVAPPCIAGNRKPGTDVIVIRRVATCEAGVGTCANSLAGFPYMQSKKCATQLPESTFPAYYLDRLGSKPFNLQLRDCSGTAGLRAYVVHAYWIGTDNGRGQAIDTLWRGRFNGRGYEFEQLVEGIEELNVEYGVDVVGQPADPAKLDGQADGYSADPKAFAMAGCTICTPPANMSNIVSARVHLLARALEASPNYQGTKTYSLGYDRTGAEITVTPTDAYRRQAYSGIARIVNVAQRRETP